MNGGPVIMEFQHIPVLFKETIESLNIRPDGVYIDATAGGGGHSEAIAKKLESGRLISIDRDPDAIEACRKRLSKYSNVTVIQGNYADMKSIAEECQVSKADGILMDLGVSSYQLDNPERGFSYHNDAPLDMRMSKEGKSARDLVNSLNQDELGKILRFYGEEKFYWQISAGIIKARQKQPIETTKQLAEIVKNSVPPASRGGKHPARKTFQALRIAVNSELDSLDKGLDEAFDLLSKEARLSVISFHSLEDRIVKQKMNTWCQGCICPKDFPICVCGNKPKGYLLYKRGIVPGEEELKQNPRARSSRLRTFEKY
jgi:16S rRNA (cytosine1402-N4)-methyltransferase